MDFKALRVPYEFQFYGVCGHIFYGARAVPSENWWNILVRRPVTNRNGAGRAPFDGLVPRTVPDRGPSGTRRLPCGALFAMLDICTAYRLSTV